MRHREREERARLALKAVHDPVTPTLPHTYTGAHVCDEYNAEHTSAFAAAHLNLGEHALGKGNERKTRRCAPLYRGGEDGLYRACFRIFKRPIPPSRYTRALSYVYRERDTFASTAYLRCLITPPTYVYI